MKHKGRRVLITGSSRGIGKAIALRFGQEGANVVVHYRSNKAEAEQVASDIEKMGGKSFVLRADMEKPEEIKQMVSSAWEAFGGIDVLINNAGIANRNSFLDIEEAEFDEVVRVNYKGTFLITQGIARLMVANGLPGDILTVTSVNGIRPGVKLSNYGATKGALEVLMKGAALELAPKNIRVNTLAVGAVETEMNASVKENPELFQSIINGIPMGRFGLPSEIAALVSDIVASGSYLTGASITVDGGLLLMRGYGKP